MAAPGRAHRLRHGAVVLAELGGRRDLNQIRDVLPQLDGEFQVDPDSEESPSHRTRSEWRGFVINRFAGTNAFRSWLDASADVRRAWVH
jgi:Mg2+/Co2+ transporter CorC